MSKGYVAGGGVQDCGDPTLALVHAHSQYESRDEHQATPKVLNKATPEGVNSFIAFTPYEPPFNLDSVREDVAAFEGAEIRVDYGSYFIVDYEDSSQAVVNGREFKLQNFSGYEDEHVDAHVVQLFRPEDQPVIESRDLDALEERLDACPLNWISHPTTPQYSAPEDAVEELLEDYDLDLGLPKMYHPFLNKVSRGEWTNAANFLSEYAGLEYPPGQKDVHELAQEHNVAVIPEQDWKSALAPNNQGLGYSETDIVGLLEGENVEATVDGLRDLDVIGTKRREKPYFWNEPGMTFWQALMNNPQLAGMIPIDILDDVNHENLRDKSIGPGLSAEELDDRAQTPGKQGNSVAGAVSRASAALSFF